MRGRPLDVVAAERRLAGPVADVAAALRPRVALARTSSAASPPAPSSSPRRWPTPPSPTSRSQVGLYTCMVPMVVYALLGGSRTLSVSTTSTVAVLTGSTLLAAGVAAAGDDPARDLAMLTLLVGVILLAARVLRLGTLDRQHLRGDAHRASRSASASPSPPASCPSCSGIPGDPTADNFFAARSGPSSTSSATSAGRRRLLGRHDRRPARLAASLRRSRRRSSPSSSASCSSPCSRSTSTAWR